MSSRGNYNRRGYNRRPQQNRNKRSGFYLSKGTTVYILDKLKHGGIDREKHGWNPICQVIKTPSFELFEMEYEKGADLKLQDKIEIMGKGGKLGKVNRRLKYGELTITAMDMLEPVLITFIKENEDKYVNWINKAGPITIRRHYLELLPGVGKVLMKKILEEREREPFKSIKDLHERVAGFTPIKSIAQRILTEMEDEEVKHHVFVRKNIRNSDQKSDDGGYSNRGQRSPSPRYSNKSSYRPRRY